MKELLLCPSVRRRFWSSLPLLLILFAAAGLTAYIGGGLMFVRPAEPGLEWLAVLSGVGALAIALLFFYGVYEVLKDSQTQIAATEEWIEKRTFGKVKARILWDDLMEVGIAMENGGGRGGPFYSLYFADCALEQIQRAAHIEGEVKQGTELSALCRDLERAHLEDLESLCPLPLPLLKKDGQGTDYDLLTYRRARNPDGTWGEPYADRIPDAAEFRRRQQKRA